MEGEKEELNFIIEGEEQPIPVWHKALIERRIADSEQKPENTITWEEFKSKIEAMK